jgi:low affinity Fe/Cu permease
VTAPPAADRRNRTRNHLSRIVAAVVTGAASTITSVAAVLLMIVWVVVGLGAGFTDRWLSVLFAVTSAVTFVMVFVIQHTTGRQLRAVLLKLDTLIHAQPDADDELIAAERRPLHEQDHLERDASARRASTATSA